VELEVQMYEVMRLTRPVAGAERPSVTSPVEIAWGPILGAAQYSLAIFPDDGNGEGVTVMVTEPRWRGNLSMGTHSMQLVAVDEHDERLGQLDADEVFEVVDPERQKLIRPASCPESLPITLCDQVPVADRQHVEHEAGRP
jgi:hypothetical protein